jgi:hypothetical protein
VAVDFDLLATYAQPQESTQRISEEQGAPAMH